ncbi:MAG: DEAD/DEAH box helicase [Nevskiaceae bacterium]|nr:MAG: DEAD/DEAH box helicase [Nevskiaceae bacterium]TBR72730.1 MAG: DEAD/DEAH box helicase [Nevskiaceae bacterium]
MKFQDFGLSAPLLDALSAQGYADPTPVQQRAIPLALEGRDLMASAPTGTGKTAAFALPILEHLFPAGHAAGARGPHPRVLVLTPTRELAAQVHANLRDYAKQLPLRSTTIFGGVSMHNQIDVLRRGVDVLVATPGRLIDHLDHGTAKLSNVDVLVLDEADRMLDMGFRPALRRIMAQLPRERQTLLFSATFAGPVKELAQQFLRNPATVQVSPPNSVTATVTHRVHPVDTARKVDLLLHILSEDPQRQTLVFTRTKHGADKLVRVIEKAGFHAAAIHGNKSQNQRTRALRNFKDHGIAVLVATDIAARGLDIEQLPLVINYDLPMVAEDYVHRIGRTGRAGADGVAISFVTQENTGLLRDIQKLLDEPLDVAPMPGFEPGQALNLDSNVRPQQQPRGGQPRGARPHTGHAHAGAKPGSRSRPAGRSESGQNRSRNVDGVVRHAPATRKQRRPPSRRPAR